MKMTRSTGLQMTKLIAFTLLVVASSLSHAELRVIMEYDDAEHRLLRLVELTSTNAPVSDHIKQGDKKQADAAVKLYWYDVHGALIRSSSMNDPRLTHAPMTGTGQSPTVVGLDKGAYMVSGPSGAVLLEIHLPQSAVLGLDFQVWKIDLTRL